MAYFAFGVLHVDPDALDVEAFASEAVDSAHQRGVTVILGGPGLRSGLIGEVLEEHELQTRACLPFLVLGNPVHRDSDHVLFEGDADRVEHDLNRPAIAALAAWCHAWRAECVTAIDFFVTDAVDAELETRTIEPAELLDALDEQAEIDGLVPVHLSM